MKSFCYISENLSTHANFLIYTACCVTQECSAGLCNSVESTYLKMPSNEFVWLVIV